MFAIAEFQMHIWRLTQKTMQLIYKWNRNKKLEKSCLSLVAESKQTNPDALYYL